MPPLHVATITVTFIPQLSVVPKSPLHAVPEEAVFESSMKTISFLEDQDTKAIASLQLATVTQNGIATSEEESV